MLDRVSGFQATLIKASTNFESFIAQNMPSRAPALDIPPEIQQKAEKEINGLGFKDTAAQAFEPVTPLYATYLTREGALGLVPEAHALFNPATNSKDYPEYSQAFFKTMSNQVAADIAAIFSKVNEVRPFLLEENGADAASLQRLDSFEKKLGKLWGKHYSDPL
jgi:hypothetical protein